MTITVVYYIFNLDCQLSLCLKPRRSLNFCLASLQCSFKGQKVQIFKVSYHGECTEDLRLRKLIMVLAHFGFIFVRLHCLKMSSSNL